MRDQARHPGTVRAYRRCDRAIRAGGAARRVALVAECAMSSAPPAASIRFATRADALGIAEMSRDLIEHGLGWSWTRERVLRSLRHRDTNAVVAVREADRAGFAHHEIRRRRGAPAAARGQAGASRGCGVGSALVDWLERSRRGRRRRPHHARGARRQRRRARLLSAGTATRRRSCCPATTAAARRACAWSRTSACRRTGRAMTRRRLRRVRCARRRCRRAPAPSRAADRRGAAAARAPSASPASADECAVWRRERGVRAHASSATTRAAFASYLHAGRGLQRRHRRARSRPRRGGEELGRRSSKARAIAAALAAGHRRTSAASRRSRCRAGPTSCSASRPRQDHLSGRHVPDHLGPRRRRRRLACPLRRQRDHGAAHRRSRRRRSAGSKSSRCPTAPPEGLTSAGVGAGAETRGGGTAPPRRRAASLRR